MARTANSETGDVIEIAAQAGSTCHCGNIMENTGTTSSRLDEPSTTATRSKVRFMLAALPVLTVLEDDLLGPPEDAEADVAQVGD